LLYYGNSIKKEKDTIKEKNRAKGKGTGGLLKKIGLGGLDFTGRWGKEEQKRNIAKVWTSHSL
jgi:hypothetical protein